MTQAVRPLLPRQPHYLDRCASFTMSAVLLWLMLAALLVLPVVLRFIGDEPDNAIRHEQDGSRRDQDDGRPDEPDLLAAA